MARLIDADALKQFPIRIDHYDKDHGNEDFVLGIETVLEYAEHLHTVDAVPVVHGRWLYDSGSGKHFCSVCDEFALSFRKDRWAVGELYEVFLTDYCPHCGAKMDGGAGDD